MKNLFLLAAASLIITACSDSTSQSPNKDVSAVPDSSKTNSNSDSKQPVTIADAATIMGKKQVPILCYHHIKEVDVLPKNTAGYTVTASKFKDHMKVLADSGYKTITPEEYYQYLTVGAALPEKPVMITYDDTDEEQFSIAKPEMDKYGFKGVYYIMTISIGRPRYMTKEQIKQLSDEGHVIASHTWDHSRVDRYVVGERMIQDGKRQKKFNDWDVQLTQTRKKLEEITGKQIEYFAYPFGIWSKEAIPEIQKRGYKMAFQLSTKRDSLQPLYTARRIIVAPSWTGQGLLKAMNSSFR